MMMGDGGSSGMSPPRLPPRGVLVQGLLGMGRVSGCFVSLRANSVLRRLRLMGTRCPLLRELLFLIESLGCELSMMRRISLLWP